MEGIYSELTEHQPKQGEILFTKNATPDIAYYLRETPKGMVPPGGILRMKIKDKHLNKDYLILILHSLLVKEQIDRDVGSSVIQHWRPDQATQALIPILGNKKQEKIKKRITKSFKFRKQSMYLLEVAKTAVGMAIEKSEKEAEKWLKKVMEDVNA